MRGVILEQLKSYLNNRKQKVDLKLKKNHTVTLWIGKLLSVVFCRALFWDPCCLIYTIMTFQK
jgi:hypothetical protein